MYKMVVPYSSNVCENSLIQWNVWIHWLPRENVITMSPVLVGRNFSSVDILLTITLCKCNVMTLLNNLSGTGARFVACIESRSLSLYSNLVITAGTRGSLECNMRCRKWRQNLISWRTSDFICFNIYSLLPNSYTRFVVDKTFASWVSLDFQDCVRLNMCKHYWGLYQFWHSIKCNF